MGTARRVHIFLAFAILVGVLNKSTRFSNSDFPKRRPVRRHTFSWGSVSFFENETLKVAVVVSKKTLNRANQRNRLRRRVRSALAEALKNKNPTAGGMVVFPRTEALTAPHHTLVCDLEGSFDE